MDKYLEQPLKINRGKFLCICMNVYTHKHIYI